MLAFSTISSEQLNDDNLLRVLWIVQGVLDGYGAEGILIGARARDIQLLQHNLKPPRATRDVDWAVKTASIKTYDATRDELVRSFDFRPYGTEPYRLLHGETRTMLDLLPFGGIARAGIVTFSDRHKTRLQVAGIKEVSQAAQMVQIDSNITLRVATLPGIFILKLLAWQSDQSARLKDIADIRYIIEHYFEVVTEEIYRQHLDLFGDTFEPEIAGTRVLGRHLQTILSQSGKLRGQIVQIMHRHAADPTDSPLGELLAAGTARSVKEMCYLLHLIIKGIEDRQN